MILDVQELCSGYNKSTICFNVSLQIHEGERVCLLGRNGVGKTTFLKTIIRLITNTSGSWYFRKERIDRKLPHQVARLGMGYVPQGRGIFSALSVMDNLRLGTIAEKGKISEIDPSLFYYFPILKERLKQRAGTLSGGEQQMLSIARALAGNPKLLLLDEPSEGLQPSVIQNLVEVIKSISDERKIAILLVEQNLDIALDVCMRGYVMEKGTIVEQGSSEDLHNASIVKEYLSV